MRSGPTRAHRRVDRWGWLWSQSASPVLASNDGASCLLLNLRELSSLGQSSVLHMKSRYLGPWSKRFMESRPSGASSTLLACGPQMGRGRFELAISWAHPEIRTRPKIRRLKLRCRHCTHPFSCDCELVTCSVRQVKYRSRGAASLFEPVVSFTHDSSL